MSYGNTQPRPGHLKQSGGKGKDSGGKGDGQGGGGLAAKNPKAATSSYYPKVKNPPQVTKVRPEPGGQHERAYAQNVKGGGHNVKNTSAGRVRKIGGK